MNKLVEISLGVLSGATLFYLVFMNVIRIDTKMENIFHSENKNATPNVEIPHQFQYLTNALEKAKRRQREALKFLKLPTMNNFNITYKVSVHSKCEQLNPKVVIVVLSARQNFFKRLDIRDGAIGRFCKINRNATLLFFVGTPGQNENVPSISKRIDYEVKLFNDLIVVDFEDNYTNILQKHLAMMKWIIEFCSKSEFVLRLDDDVTLHNGIEKATKAFERHRKKRENFILGTQRVGDVPSRDKGQPHWLLTKEQYPADQFPAYVLGGALGYPVSTIKLLYQAAQRVKTVWLDDVFISGICASALGIPTINDIDFKFHHSHSPIVIF